jgi:hypothetical protein
MTFSPVCFRILLLAPVICLVMANRAGADFIITGGTATVAPGDTGTVDFRITSSNPTGDRLASFNLELQASVKTGTSFLQFTTNQPAVYDRSGYVFSGDSGDKAAGLSFWGPPTQTVTSNDTISGGDFTNSGSAITISPSSNFFLATVRFQAGSHATPGDSFAISLVPRSGSGTLSTYFQDSGGTNIPYTSADATVTVATAVPGPSSLVLAGVGSLTCLLYRWKGRRKASRLC